ncbi:MAG: WecB/TagA/CpsF family glycosyltransferase [Acaryochloridaceae cyanobacterium RU_4_10]|nr:WecB/TagA/CpsF family glycosyltransferase [Acaryochloridaceae cyanobacterium RU_4_10]
MTIASPKERILSTTVSITDYKTACDRIFIRAAAHQSCYIIAANVHVVMTAYWNPTYRQVVNQAALVTPDGMPLVWALRWLGWPQATRVYGPDLMVECCQRADREQVPIYLYGGTDTMLQKLQENLRSRYPSLQIVGAHAPPFRDLTPTETASDIERIHQSGAAIVFVALGCPKQELWMAQQQGKLQAVAIGVGAAFAFHSGEVSQAPRWMMATGLEWLYRFAVEPKRLWKRYLLNNPAFVLLFGLQLLKRKLTS